jgi:hypothetical protein
MYTSVLQTAPKKRAKRVRTKATRVKKPAKKKSTKTLKEPANRSLRQILSAPLPNKMGAISPIQWATQTRIHLNVLKLLADSELSKINKSAYQNNNSEPAIIPVENPISCPLCNESFSLSSDFYRHSNAQHQEKIKKNWHRCLQCLWLFPSKKSVRNHGCNHLEHNLLQPDLDIKEEPANLYHQEQQGKTKKIDIQHDRCLLNKSYEKIDTSHSKMVNEVSSNKSESKCFEQLKKVISSEKLSCISNNNEGLREIYQKENVRLLKSQR